MRTVVKRLGLALGALALAASCATPSSRSERFVALHSDRFS